MNFRLLFFLLISCFLIQSCQSRYLAKKHTEFPDPVDTSSKPIDMQEKKRYTLNGVTADNLFDGARMNDFEIVDDDTYRVTILPENEPINKSPHFAFRLTALTDKEIDLEIYYGDYEHRYWPKLSHDGEHWMPIDSSDFDTLKAPNLATLRLNLTSDTLWVAAQELYNSAQVAEWIYDQCTASNVRHSIIGKSKLGRDLHCMDIYEGDPQKRETVVILSRQHPPEISGYLAMEAFVEELLDDNPISNDFRKRFRVLVYPLINPDGVDLGHWRHSAGGIDLNRDWAVYNQEEPKAVANHIVKTTKQGKNKVVVGLDFHSTQRDLYYTLPNNRKSNVYGFKDYWLHGIDNTFDDYSPDDRPGDINQPITKFWFYLQFGAEGITYEIGDETPRDFVKEKGRASAQELMKLLILR